jgi:hypothetical protein
MKHVATAMSKSGGPCRRCQKHIERGESIFKFPSGDAVKAGQKNGPGIWVCFECMVVMEGYEKKQEVLFDA